MSKSSILKITIVLIGLVLMTSSFAASQVKTNWLIQNLSPNPVDFKVQFLLEPDDGGLFNWDQQPINAAGGRFNTSIAPQTQHELTASGPADMFGPYDTIIDSATVTLHYTKADTCYVFIATVGSMKNGPHSLTIIPNNQVMFDDVDSSGRLISTTPCH